MIEQTEKRYLTDEQCYGAFCAFYNFVRPGANLTVEDIMKAKIEREAKENQEKQKNAK